MQKNSSYDGLVNSKNTICEAVRTALASPAPSFPTSIPRNVELFDPIPQLTDCFKNQFITAGGKYVPFDVDSQAPNSEKAFVQRKMFEYLKFELEESNCHKILNASAQLAPALSAFGITTTDVLVGSETVDAVIVYAEFLIARTGSIVFSQRNDLMLYPSIKNLARNIIVLAYSNGIVPDLHQLIDITRCSSNDNPRLEEYDFDFDMMEIITPTKQGNENPTPANPHVTLILINEF